LLDLHSGKQKKYALFSFKHSNACHFATTVTLSNGVPIESVSKMPGHSKITTTQVYAKVIERKLSDDMQVLKQKLAEIVGVKKRNRQALNTGNLSKAFIDKVPSDSLVQTILQK